MWQNRPRISKGYTILRQASSPVRLFGLFPLAAHDFRAGIPWQSYAAVPGFFVGIDYRDPHFTFLRQIHEWFPELEAAIPVEVARRLAKAEADGGVSFGDRGAVWTYLTTDQPFGAWTERVLKGIRKKLLRQGT